MLMIGRGWSWGASGAAVESVGLTQARARACRAYRVHTLVGRWGGNGEFART